MIATLSLHARAFHRKAGGRPMPPGLSEEERGQFCDSQAWLWRRFLRYHPEVAREFDYKPERFWAFMFCGMSEG